ENIGYPLYTPDISTAEQNPEEIFSAVLQSIANIMENHSDKNLSFISFSSAMHSVIAMDEDHLPLTPVITWADNRS
ncbi:FGGY family carbohydrate kinase, partial [Escherichia coli]|nr:FGGY family carbohydrate kinase [Escherichia coli]